MKNWIAMFAVCSAASGAFAEVVSLIPGQQVVVPASVPGSVPVTIEAGLLKQTSQLSWLPAYQCQNFTATQLKDPNGPASDQNFCDWGGVSILNFWSNVSLNIKGNKPTTLKSTYAPYYYNNKPYSYLFRDDINGTWTSIKLDLISGAPTEVMNAIDYSMTTGPALIGGISTGGAYRERNMRFSLVDKRVYSDVEGASTATSYRSSVAYKQISFPIWAFDSWEGPALPISRLASTQNIIARTQYLTQAGFKVTDLGDGTLYAVGSYKTLNMHMTSEGQDLFSNCLGFLKYARSGLRSLFAGAGELDNWDYNPVALTTNIGYFIN